MLLQWHIEDPGHSAKSAGARIHLNTHTPFRLYPSKFEWANYAAVRAECWNLSGNVLTRNMSGNTRSQVSQFAEPLSTDPGLKSGISLLELIFTSKKKKGRRGINCLTFSQNLAREEKATTTTSVGRSLLSPGNRLIMWQHVD